MSNISLTAQSMIKCSNICIIVFSEYKADFTYILTSCLLCILQYFYLSLLSYSATSSFHCNFTPRTIMLQISIRAVGQEMGERYKLYCKFFSPRTYNKGRTGSQRKLLTNKLFANCQLLGSTDCYNKAQNLLVMSLLMQQG